MQSNRESARRSRLRKQMHLEDLMNCICLLRKKKSQVLTSIDLIKKQYVEMEAENSVLRAQLIELTKRLQSLKHICITSTTPRPPPPPPPPAAGGAACSGLSNFSIRELVDGFILNHPWNMMGPNQYPVILASAEMLDY
ncbi:UNVERIFIED_CONTAM: bZIP transcription factor 44 [Sesamum indicum]